jgi:hypothetical protein
VLGGRRILDHLESIAGVQGYQPIGQHLARAPLA